MIDQVDARWAQTDARPPQDDATAAEPDAEPGAEALRADVETLRADADRLRSRLDRERKARRQAEMIAERGMRELWETNRDLQDRVAQRTAELERVTNALEYAQIARLRAVHDLVDDLAADLAGHDPHVGSILEQLRSLTEPARSVDHAAASGNSSVELADRLVERWQRSAAKRGQLLTVEQGDSTVDDVAHWPQMLAVADTLIGAIVRVGRGGSTAVRLTCNEDTADLRVGGSALDGVLGGAEIGRGTTPDPCEIRADVALAAQVATTVGGALRIADIDGGIGLVVSLPQPR